MLQKFKYNEENKNIFMIDEPVRKKLASLKKLVQLRKSSSDWPWAWDHPR